MTGESAVLDRPQVRALTLLLLEDKPQTREQFAQLLRDQGFTVHTAADGQAAVKLALEQNIDAAVIDLALDGDFDGVDAALAIQQELPQVPLIFLTAHTYHEGYRGRVAASGLRVLKWVQKGALRFEALVGLIEDELAAVGRLPAAASAGPVRGATTVPHVHEDAMTPQATIDSLYDEIHGLMQAASARPELRSGIATLVERLRLLQRQEADAMERRYRARLLLQPGDLRRALAQARSLLGK